MKNILANIQENARTKMNDLQRTRVRQAANTEAVRRMLIKYFSDRGYTESFDKAINPINIQDMPFANVGMDTKLEIEPHAIEIDPTTSRATLGWNMFVLGNQRIFLGETQHQNLLELARQIKSGQILADAIVGTRRCTTPRRIIMFIERVLNGRNSGYIDISPRDRQMSGKPRPYRPLGGGSNQESSYYTRAGYGT
jgi:hypothetical protein